MTWKDFITPIQKSKISGDVSSKILIDLFDSAGSKNEVSLSAAKSWLSRKRNCKTSTYFPSGKVDAKSLFGYFRYRPDDKLERLQQMFRDETNLDADSPIDVDTNDIDTFCWSHVNQFLDLHGLRRVDVPHTDTPSEATFAETSRLLNDRSADISEDATPDHAQGTPSVLSSIDRTDVPVERNRSIRSMILPHSDDCCYYCVYWEGNRQTFGAYMTATYGFCLKYNRQKQLSSDLPCKDYKKRQKLFGDW